MWPFRRQPVSKSDQARITDIEIRLEAIERDFKGIEIEWESCYEKFRVAMAKLARRSLVAAQEAEKPAQDAPGSTIPSSDGLGYHDTLVRARSGLRGVLPR